MQRFPASDSLALPAASRRRFVQGLTALTALGDLLARLDQGKAAARCYRLALLVDPACRNAARNVALLKTSGEVSIGRPGRAAGPRF